MIWSRVVAGFQYAFATLSMATEAIIMIVAYIQARHILVYSRDLSLENSNPVGERKQAPFRKRGDACVCSLSGAAGMSEKEKLDQEIPIPPGVEEWVHVVEMQYKVES
jgi:hypothetical protein